MCHGWVPCRDHSGLGHEELRYQEPWRPAERRGLGDLPWVLYMQKPQSAIQFWNLCQGDSLKTTPEILSPEMNSYPGKGSIKLPTYTPNLDRLL